MPCYDSRNTYEYAHSEQQKVIDRYANWLCEILTGTPEEVIDLLAPELQQWWKEHQDFDKLRDESTYL